MTGTGELEHGTAGPGWSGNGCEPLPDEQAASGDGDEGGSEPSAEWPDGYVPV